MSNIDAFFRILLVIALSLLLCPYSHAMKRGREEIDYKEESFPPNKVITTEKLKILDCPIDIILEIFSAAFKDAKSYKQFRQTYRNFCLTCKTFNKTLNNKGRNNILLTLTTPVHKAFAQDNLEQILQYKFEHASLTAKDGLGLSPICYAIIFEHEPALQLFQATQWAKASPIAIKDLENFILGHEHHHLLKNLGHNGKAISYGDDRLNQLLNKAINNDNINLVLYLLNQYSRKILSDKKIRQQLAEISQKSQPTTTEKILLFAIQCDVEYDLCQGYNDSIQDSKTYNADINSIFHGSTPLIHAVEMNKLGFIKTLLENKADINRQDSDKQTALIKALQRKEAPIVEFLLAQKNINLNIYDGDAFYYAVKHSSKDCLLLLHNADIDKTGKNNETCLTKAVLRNQIASVKTLLAAKADANKIDRFGRLPLRVAAACDFLDILQLLIPEARLEARDSSNLTAALEAAQKGHDRCLRALLENGANVEAQDSRGLRAITYAIRGNHHLCVQHLINFKASTIFFPEHGNGSNDFYCVMAHTINLDRGEILAMLLKAGVKWDDNRYKKNALQYAIQKNSTSCAKCLIECNGNINTYDLQGWTCLMATARHPHAQMVKWLLENNASVNLSMRKGNYNVPHAAASGGSAACIKMLCEAKADVNMHLHDDFFTEPEHHDWRGFTPLHIAVFKGNAVSIRALIEHGANVNAVDTKGVTPLQMALERGLLRHMRFPKKSSRYCCKFMENCIHKKDS